MSGRAKSDVVKKGERVRARWSGSKVFYDAKVIEVFAKSAKVQFDDGSVSSVKIPDIKKFSSEMSPSPKEIKITRSRSQSTGRTRSRSRSPARKERKTSEKKTKSKRGRKPANASNSNIASSDEVDSRPETPLTREKIGPPKHESTAIKATNSYSSSFDKREGSTGSERIRSARIAAMRAAEEAKQESSSAEPEKTNAKRKGTYSDDEDEEEVAGTTVPKYIQAARFIYTMLKILILPGIFIFLAFACTKKHCTVYELPQFYSRWRDFGNSVKFPFAAVAAFHSLQCILALIPLGKKVTGFPTDTHKSPLEYRLNGLLALLLSILTFGVCAYFGVYTNWGYDKFRPIALSCALYSILCAVILHIFVLVKGVGAVNNKVPFIGSFYDGSLVNPIVLKRVDVKTSFIRAGLIGAVVLNLSILLKYFLMKGHMTIPLAMTSGMQIFFILDLFIREERLLSAATYTADTVGYGFILKTGFLIPIGLALPNIYLFNYDAKASLLPHWCSGSMLVLYVLGYYIYLTSTNLKHGFRRNPFDSSLSEVASIPTSKKKRLIASRMWGLVRHPNYLGLFLMALAWTLPSGFTHLVPFGPLILLVLSIILRTVKVEGDCKEKYGPAWSNYTERVRCRLLPFIF